MSDAEQSRENNARQLSAALADLRSRLERLAQKPAPDPSPPPPPPTPTKTVSVPTPPPPPTPPLVALPAPRAAVAALPAPSKAVTRDSILSLFTQTTAPATPAAKPVETIIAPTVVVETPPDPPPEEKAPAEEAWALDQLGERLGLSPFEKSVLLLCAAMELDTRIAGLCAQAQDDPEKPYPTFALALTLFDNPTWAALSPGAPLRYWRLIEVNPSGAQALTASPLRADERIVSYLKGLNRLDDRLRSLLMALDLGGGPDALAPSQSTVVEMIVHRWQQAAGMSPVPVVQLAGSDPVSKQLVASHAAGQINRSLYRLPVEMLPCAPAETEALARLWQREGRLSSLALYLDAEDLTDASSEALRALTRFLSTGDGVFFLGVREALPRLGRNDIVLDVAKPTAAEQQAAWTEALGDNTGDTAASLASQFNLNLSTLLKLAHIAQADVPAGGEALSDKVWEACCAAERPRLDALAQRLEPKVAWDDLILPAAEMSSLRQLAAQVGHRDKVYHQWGLADKITRGLGISALFAGASGTGKTMAAEVIANELRLNLYRIDLSAVVSKYIGETEKNLRRLFDAAEDGGAILFFDEADALFGKRSEVKDSHDRYANIEINYLLQRLESYRGLAILATNQKSALDTAFLRRLRLIIDFPTPGPADRKRLWQRVFRQPEAASRLPAPPLDQLDYDRLAKLNMAGGDIQNTALNAAFMAARAGTKVTMALILEAARAEFLKRGGPIAEREFHWINPAPAASTSASAGAAAKLAPAMA